jgi:ribosomal protein L7Ae-like RNA K-turn-binding protein
MSDKAIGYLGLMRRGGMIELGENGVAEAVRGRKAKLLLLVPDAGENARDRAESLAKGHGVPLAVLPYTREELSMALGKANTVMAAVTDAGFAQALMKTLSESDGKYADIYELMVKRAARSAGRTGTRRKNA